MIKLDTKPTKTTIIVYAPTSKKEADDDTDRFYEDLQSVLCTLKGKDPVIIMGDFNAKVGEGQQKEAGLGPHGLGIRNERGERLLAFFEVNKFKITNTQFMQHPRRKYTWISPNKERHQLDYILISSNWMSSCLSCKTKPGADHDTDHIYLESRVIDSKLSDAKHLKWQSNMTLIDSVILTLKNNTQLLWKTNLKSS